MLAADALVGIGEGAEGLRVKGNLRDNKDPFEASIEYGDVTKAEKGQPVPVIGGEQLVPVSWISSPRRVYTEVAADEKPGKK